MDVPRLLRHIDQMQIRIKNLEDTVNEIGTLKSPDEPLDLFSIRDDADFENVEIAEEFISGSPLLSSLYTSENKKVTKFSVGTWPGDESSTKAMVVHGGQVNQDGEPIELVRMKVYPALINAGVPFSAVQVDVGEEQPYLQQNKLINDAASHLVSKQLMKIPNRYLLLTHINYTDRFSSPLGVQTLRNRLCKTVIQT